MTGLQAEMFLEELFDLWPQTVIVFIRHRMACVGCPMARFTTIADAAGIYNIQLDAFLPELERATMIPEEGYGKSNSEGPS